MQGFVEEAMDDGNRAPTLLTIANPYDQGLSGLDDSSSIGHGDRRTGMAEMMEGVDRQANEYGADGIVVIGDTSPYHAEQILQAQEEGDVPWYWVPGPVTSDFAENGYTSPVQGYTSPMRGDADISHSASSAVRWWNDTYDDYPDYVQTLTAEIQEALNDQEQPTSRALAFDLGEGRVLFTNALTAPRDGYATREEGLRWVDLETADEEVLRENARWMDEYEVPVMLRSGTYGSNGHRTDIIVSDDEDDERYMVFSGDDWARKWNGGRLPDDTEMAIGTVPDVAHWGVYETVLRTDHVVVQQADERFDTWIDWDDYTTPGSEVSVGADDARSTPTDPAVPRPLHTVAQVPDAETIASVSDIHGYRDSLDTIDQMLAEELGLGGVDVMVYNGDPMDRGPDSAGVMDRIREYREAAPFHVVQTVGNHDLAFMMPHQRGLAGSGEYWTLGGVDSLEQEEEREQFLQEVADGDITAAFEGHHFTYAHAGQNEPIPVQDVNDALQEAGAVLLDGHREWQETGDIDPWYQAQQWVHARSQENPLYATIFRTGDAGGRGPDAGLTWMDFKYMTGEAPPQIVGHTREPGNPRQQGDVINENTIRDAQETGYGEAVVIEEPDQVYAFVNGPDGTERIDFSLPGESGGSDVMR